MVQEYLIALGSNLGSDQGDRTQTLAQALAAFVDRGIQLRRVSRFYSTPCFPAGAGPDYVNAAAALAFDGSAAELLEHLHHVEHLFGRERKQRWGSRSLDLDLIAAGDAVLPDASLHARWRALPPDAQLTETPGQLILPHPRVQERAFVLVPLNDVAAGWMHPILRQNVAQMLATLPAHLREEPVPLLGNDL
ncbi:2-amino-4-hydroxy-6-hydroxymethyldihydropteridine diphosphokinase [Tropicibacter naphthalenivorans]|uniref:2-amino-4-hydroxy-6-hydroxymethyldihydropteridine pyrophosphokinase n=1 Tax=Tropicibacter naphthalenivorans TaxID=441103 RepID=A0A0P1GA64_9RHOB|nr:2-amino-4-hydroxy-6-hydroxymethyldihydropteridine diphosphokinase [Tropicibacter naphthalenivorans]CUH78366.1 Bifunctional folate synthesis protein [Tropicibacter naphthalenivorans]SMC79973.1 2-amino-4-hydroxy-6-hydroxymethyldihydropteridinediphosphokinase [Tropicibacter naphthalenivorans]